MSINDILRYFSDGSVMGKGLVSIGDEATGAATTTVVCC